MSRRNMIVLILLAGSAVYSNSLQVPFVLDDLYTIEFLGKKPFLELLLHGTSRRVADFTFALNYRLHGMSVTGYHLTNLAIHLITALLVYFIMHSVLTALRGSFNVPPETDGATGIVERYFPGVVTLLFVLHPLQTQAVSYTIQRYTSLATCFYLLAVLLFLKGRVGVENKGKWLKITLLFCGATLAGLLALGCKQIALTLPVMLIVLEAFMFRGRLLNRRFLVVCGIFGLIVVAGILYRWRDSSLNDFLFDLRHATSEDLFFTRTSYFLTQLRVVVIYLRLLVAPFGQSLVHESPIYTTLAMPVIVSLLGHLALCAGAVRLFWLSRRNFLSNAGTVAMMQRLASFGVVWFYWALAIESSIFPIRDVMFEHRVYLPSVGFFMLVAALLMLAVQSRRFPPATLWAIPLVVSLVLGSLTVKRNNVWNNSLLLWQEAVANAPGKWLTQSNLAGEYMDRHQPDKALPLLIRALELNPGLFIRTKVYLGDAMKEMHLFEGRFTTGQEYIVAGGIFGSGDLDYKNIAQWDGVINNNIALAYEYLQQPQKARKAYEVAVTLNPAYDMGWYNFGLFSLHNGDLIQARVALLRLNALNPGLAARLEAELPK